MELFSGLDFSMEPGRKLALIGPNGSGKTSLLRIMAGLDDDFDGRVIRSPELRFGYVPQRFEPDPGAKVLDILLEDVQRSRKTLADIEEAMSGSGDFPAEMLERYGRLREEYEESGGDDAEDTAQRLLARAGLGGSADKSASILSGGEANLLGLLKALVSKPNLLALDEPGNHLDLWGQSWLEDFLKNLPTALLLVSHNRWLIDRVADETLALEGGRLTRSCGGYSAFRLERLRKAAADGAGWQADRKKIERLEALVKRFALIAASRADPAWGKRLRARRSQLEREKNQARERPDIASKNMDLRFADPASRSTYALTVNGYRKAYGERVLLESSGFDVLRGEKVALVGRNGCGKTSFLRDLIATGENGAAGWSGAAGGSGDAIRLSPSASVGYIAQARDDFPKDMTVAGVFEALGAKPEEIRKLLKRFLFERDDLDRSVDALSGGEFKRLQLARTVWTKADFLVLDEPTNHLDIAGREAVEDALNEFEGTILMVSHDRFLLEAVADRVVYVDERRFIPYEGNFSEFWRDAGLARTKEIKADSGMDGRAAALAGKKGDKASLKIDKIRAARDGSSDKKNDAGLSDAKSGLADRIEAMERERTLLEKSAEKAVKERDFSAGRKLAAEIESLSHRIEDLYSQWCR
jgi:ATP-binding cassette, subfamily F, member 3